MLVFNVKTFVRLCLCSNLCLQGVTLSDWQTLNSLVDLHLYEHMSFLLLFLQQKVLKGCLSLPLKYLVNVCAIKRCMLHPLRVNFFKIVVTYFSKKREFYFITAIGETRSTALQLVDLSSPLATELQLPRNEIETY